MVVDTKLDFAAVDILIAAHQIFIGDIDSDNVFRLKILTRARIRHEFIAFGELVVADNSASDSDLGKDILEGKACADAVAVGISVCDDNSVITTSEKLFSFGEANLHLFYLL